MIMSKGSLTIFWSNPLVSTLTAIGLLLLCWPMIAAALRRVVPVRQPADAFED
jgi:TctA family transporter